MKKILVVLFTFVSLTAFCQNKILPKEVRKVLPKKIRKEIQIDIAVLAAPEIYRDAAKVLGYNRAGKLVTLREGRNHMICIADDPKKEGIKVVCYGKELEPFMARGRELDAQGKTVDKKEIRKKEIDAGTLKMPIEPAMLYVLVGEEKNYNPTTGELKNGMMRYVLYKPYMTGESTGLPTKPQAPGMPWLMEANTHRSHIMITPAN